jgi:pimeloyl-ACP methyl ester carboxylesterase
MAFWAQLKTAFGFMNWVKKRLPKGTPPELQAYRSEGAKTAIVFIHGFGGKAVKTWGNFPEMLAADTRLDGWDIFNLGYNTGLAPDILRKIWSADPNLDELARFLSTQAGASTLGSYEALVLVAHSMGGLIAQRALLDDRSLERRVRHLFLFGTPSGGLASAARASAWKDQLKNMADDGKFVQRLRREWRQRFSDPNFCLWVVAGDKDEFVPDNSSLAPFPDGDSEEGCVPGNRVHKRIVAGNHLEIVKPSDSATGRLSIDIVIGGIAGDAPATGPANAARVAVAQGQFQKVIDQWGDHPGDLDQAALVDLALAHDALGHHSQAMKVLADHATSTDAQGTLAGRYKRRWLLERREADADRALELYQDAYDSADDDEQALYHGINVAFMHFAFKNDQAAAKDMAQKALEHAGKATKDIWSLATEGEANLYLGNNEAAIEKYRAALAANPDPREVESMYAQAGAVADRMKDEDLVTEIERIFRPVA